MKGLNNLVKVINAIRLKLNRDLRILGLLPTFFDGRTNLARDMLDELRVVGDHHVFNSIIRNTVKLGEAPLVGKPDHRVCRFERRRADVSRPRAGGDRSWLDQTSARQPRVDCPRSGRLSPAIVSLLSPDRRGASDRRPRRRRRSDRAESGAAAPRLRRGDARGAGGVDPRARRPPADPRPPARRDSYQLVAGERRWRASQDRRAGDDPRPRRGARRRHRPRDLDHREPPARGPLARSTRRRCTTGW